MKNIIFLFLFSTTCFAQVTQEWVQRYNGPGNLSDGANAITVDNEGNVYVTGQSHGGATSHDYSTIKYNSDGAIQWVQRYNGPGNEIDAAIAIAVDNEGNVHVTGYSNGDVTNEDYATIKYNSTGVEQWVQRYNGPGNLQDRVLAIAVDNEGNVYVTGYSKDDVISGDYATIKYNSAGAIQWVQRYNGPGNEIDAATSIAVDNEGNVYVTGWSNGGATLEDYATIKYNSAGAIQWVQRYNSPGNYNEEAIAIAIDNDGNVYVTGYSYVDLTSTDYTTIKYNSDGAQQWVQNYNGPGNTFDLALAIAVDNEGNAYITGYSYGGDTTSYDYATIKYNSDGVEQWVQRYNSPVNGIDKATDIAIDNDGNVYVTGSSFGSNTTLEDYAIIKYNSDGVEQWIQRYDGPVNLPDFATAITINNEGNVYVTGKSYGGENTGYDYATIKYSQLPADVSEISFAVPENFELSQNYPNPFNPSTKISWQSPVGSHQILKIYDVLGNEIATLVDEYLPAGTYETEFSAAELSSGIYFYKLQAGSFVETKKMILIK